VESNQRQRMIDAVADVVSFKGYVAMSVDDIIGTAGVSRRTFYDNFKSKEDAYLAAFDEIGLRAVVRVQGAYAKSTRFAQGVVACLREFLDFAAAEPRYAEMCIVEVLAAGQAAVGRRNRVMKELATLLHQGAQTVPNGIRPPDLTAETVIGGIYEVIYARVLAGQATELPGLLGDLAYSMMLPYLGHEAAEREVRELTAASVGA
jgi:AcrR family transcriptional regulator